MAEDSHFASSERMNTKEINLAHNEILNHAFLTEILKKIPYVLGVLNDYRQFIFYNDEYFKSMGQDPNTLELGLRPGELFGCIHAGTAGGCGTSHNCRYCGAVNVFLKAQKSKNKVTDEAMLTLKKGDSFIAMDVEVTVSPFIYNNNNYYILSMMDINHKKMQTYLERAFFHDSVNVISGLRGVLQLLVQTSENENRELLETSLSAVSHLLDTFGQYKTMFKAESGEIELNPMLFDPASFMNDLVKRALGIDIDKKIHFDLRLSPADDLMCADRILLDRVLFNMLKNAIEASQSNSIIIFSYEKTDKYLFKVQNSGYIPEEVQARIFQRSFSTKGKGRGIGSYSMKLLAEKYLKGRVYFISDTIEGTALFCELPLCDKKKSSSP